MPDGYAHWLNSPVSYSADTLRRLEAIGRMPGPGGGAFSARPGRRVNGAGLQPSIIDGSPEKVRVTPGTAVVYDVAYASGGAYEIQIPSNVDRDLAARPGSGTSRIDRVIARVYDQDASIGATRDVTIEVVTGTPGASPAVPVIPSGALAIEIARLTVPATGSAITATATTLRTVSAGGVLPVGTVSERDQMHTDGTAYSGLVVFNEQTKALEVYDPTIGGSTPWRRYVDTRRTFRFASTPKWGTAFDPATHVPVTFADSVVGTPSGAGYLTLISDLSTMFAGVASVQATIGSQATARELLTYIDTGNQLGSRMFNSAGAVITSGSQRIDIVVHGWANA